MKKGDGGGMKMIQTKQTKRKKERKGGWLSNVTVQNG